MALAAERKISILIIGTFLVGMIIGLFFARVHEQKKTKSALTFATQSVNGQEVKIVTKETPCPREKEIRGGETVTLTNPLVEKAYDAFSFQQGFVSESYLLWGPPGRTQQSWKGQLAKQTIDDVTAGLEGNDALCVYSSLGRDVAILRQDKIGVGCEAIMTKEFIGFSCPGGA